MRLSKWFSRRTPVQQKPAQAPYRSAIEPLEGRRLLAAAVATSIYADNRGAVAVRFDKDLQASTVTRTSAKILLPGADKTLGTVDDTQVTANVSYKASTKTIQIIASVPLDSGYRVKLYSSVLKDAEGNRIDGEFNASGPSGNGTAGGDLEFRVRRDTSAQPTMRMSTSLGEIDIRLFRGDTATADAAPQTVAIVSRYANSGLWDNTFFTRNAKDFVVQGGGVKVNSKGKFSEVPEIEDLTNPTAQPPPVELGDKALNTNSRGTIALGRAQGVTGNEFFFNTVNNAFLDEAFSGGPFTVFGVVGAKGLKVIDAINASHRLNEQAKFNPYNVLADNVPVRGVTVTGETAQTGGTTTQTVNPLTNYVLISRVAILMKVVAMT